MRRLLMRIRRARSRWVTAHRNAMCNRCGYPTRQPWWRQRLGWNGCPSCWEEGGVLIRYTKAGTR